MQGRYRAPPGPWKYVNLKAANSRPWKFLKVVILESPRDVLEYELLDLGKFWMKPIVSVRTTLMNYCSNTVDTSTSLLCHVLQSTATSVSQHQGLIYCCMTPWPATNQWQNSGLVWRPSFYCHMVGRRLREVSWLMHSWMSITSLKMRLLPKVLFVTMWEQLEGCRTLIAATRNCWWQLPQLNRSTWLILMMKRRRRNPVAEERSEKR